MRALVLTPDRDSPGRKDWSGAFRVEAERLLKLHQLPAEALVPIDLGRDQGGRRRQVLEALQGASADEPLDLVALLCHGWRGGVQLGFQRTHAPHLAAALAAAGVRSLALYACSTAKDADPSAGTAGDGGFADLVRDCWSRCTGPLGEPCTGFHVDAHDRAGHTTSNPYVLRFNAGAGVGGQWLVKPGDPTWSTWAERLRDRRGSTLRLRYPLLSREQIAAELHRPHEES